MRRRNGRHSFAGSIGQQIDQILAQMEMLSQVSAANFEKQEGHLHPESTPPPGAFDEQTTLAQETLEMVARLAQVLETQLARAGRYGDLSPGTSRADEKDDRIRNLWANEDPKFVSFVEQVPETAILKLRREWRREAA